MRLKLRPSAIAETSPRAGGGDLPLIALAGDCKGQLRLAFFAAHELVLFQVQPPPLERHEFEQPTTSMSLLNCLKEPNSSGVVTRSDIRKEPPKSSRDMPGPTPRKDTGKDTREAVLKTPDKTIDWDHDDVHGDGDTIGMEPEQGIDSK